MKNQETLQISPANKEAEISKLFERANYQVMTGDWESARQQFLDILKIDATHLNSLISFAVLLVEMGYNSAAKTAYLQAIKHHPNSMLAHINLGNLYFLERQFENAKYHYQTAINISLTQKIDASQVSMLGNEENSNLAQLPHLADLAHAHQGLALIYFEEGNKELADLHHYKGYTLEPIRLFPSRTDVVPPEHLKISSKSNFKPKSLLVLIGGRGGDVPWRTFVDSKYFSTQTLAVEYFKNEVQVLDLPDHDLIFNAIGDADSSTQSLIAALELLKAQPTPYPRPLLNHPEAVLRTGRLSNAKRFNKIQGVRAPRTYLLNRLQLRELEVLEKLLLTEITFPVVLRSLGFQTGKHFEYAETFQDLVNLCGQLPGDDLLVMEFLNAKDSNGFYRKFRVMCIDGQLYPVHLALSTQWKVHYFSAAMKDSPENRSIEATFLIDMPQFIGENALLALKTISHELALDYAGIDFGLSEGGEVLFFEANSTMVLANPPADPVWDYRRGPIQRARDAAIQMLIKKAGFKNAGLKND